MNLRYLYILFLFLAFPCSSNILRANEPAKRDNQSIAGRSTIERKDDCLKVCVFLKNTTDKEIVIITGRGGDSRSVVPTFRAYIDHSVHKLDAARWVPFPLTADMGLMILTLSPGVETSYYTYIIPQPPAPDGRRIDGVISFLPMNTPGVTYDVDLGSHLIATPTKVEQPEIEK